ncbi:hypothetical protein GCM10023322_55560 [Rugosimonospora acidiphila]|uniref:Amidohydrolase-related domain-containing protein n=1 Tax=Rugosimonospora acidiphila TaxID=556531 RepID=A0ABP9SB71_9ACTN
MAEATTDTRNANSPATGIAIAGLRTAVLLAAAGIATAALDYRDMLRIATLGGAQVWNLDDQIGSLAVGWSGHSSTDSPIRSQRWSSARTRLRRHGA